MYALRAGDLPHSGVGRWSVMRVELSDGCGPEPGAYSMAVVLDDDFPTGCGCGGACCGGEPEDSLLPTLTIRERVRDAFDFTGTPQLSWRTAVHGAAVTYTERRETNDATGQTKVTATAVLGWTPEDDGPAPKESAVVWDGSGKRWELTACNPLPGRLELTMERIDDAR
jgi:hypothetical protein